MRVTVGEQLLGDVLDDLPIGGFSGSSTGDTHSSRGTSSGLERLRDLGNVRVTMSFPTKKTFATVSQAEKWLMDTLKAGGYAGPMSIQYDDGSTTDFPWAIARPGGSSYKGVLVNMTWNVRAGEKLT